MIPKSATLDRQIENFDVIGFELEKEDVESIMALNENIRICCKTPFIVGDADIFA